MLRFLVKSESQPYKYLSNSLKVGIPYILSTHQNDVLYTYSKFTCVKYILYGSTNNR